MFETLIAEFLDLLTPHGALILLNIILVDLVMSGDNAILIGMAVRNLPGQARKKAVFWWIVAATALRILLSFFAVHLMSVVGLKLVGGLLLLYVVYGFYRELRAAESQSHTHEIAAAATLGGAVWTILIADVSMSVDNVLAVSWSSHGNLAALTIGLILSILMMAFMSHFIARNLEKYPIIQWLGLFVILFVALSMIFEGSGDVQKQVSLGFHVFPVLLFVLGSVFVGLHTFFFPPLREQAIAEFVRRYWILFVFKIFSLVLALVFFGSQIQEYMIHAPVVKWMVLALVFVLFLEMVSVWRSTVKKGE